MASNLVLVIFLSIQATRGNNAFFNRSGRPVANAGLITATQTTAPQIQLGIRTTW